MKKTPSSIACDLLAGRSSRGDTYQSIRARQALADAVLGELPPFDREVLQLFYSRGYTYEQIAEKTGCDEITVRKTRDRAFHQFIGILRKKRLLKPSGLDWRFDAGVVPEVKPKSTPRPPNVEPAPTPVASPPPVKIKPWPLPDWPRDVHDAHTICKVSLSAGYYEKRSAYRRLVKQYHPDVVAHLGTDLVRLAEESMKRINRAWELISAER